MNGPPTTYVMLFYLVSRGRISGSEKIHAIYFRKGAIVYTFRKQGGCAPVAPAVLYASKSDDYIHPTRTNRWFINHTILKHLWANNGFLEFFLFKATRC